MPVTRGAVAQASKAAQLAELAQKRKSTVRVGYKRIGDYWDGAYESEHVSPYTRSAGNVDTDLMLILQDWSCDESLRGPVNVAVAQLGYNPERRANRRLVELLAHLYGKTLSDVYVTNLFPLVKTGGMSAPISREDLLWAARTFTWPEIRIVRPKLVVALGVAVFNALRSALEDPLRRCRRLDEALDEPFCCEGMMIRCQPHPAARIGKSAMFDTWLAMTTVAPHS